MKIDHLRFAPKEFLKDMRSAPDLDVQNLEPPATFRKPYVRVLKIADPEPCDFWR